MMNYPSIDLQLPSTYQPGTTTTMTKQQSGSTQASDYTKLLNVKERKELEVPMSLYVNIKLLNSIENLYSREYITKDQYNDKFQEVMEKISKIENVMTKSSWKKSKTYILFKYFRLNSVLLKILC